MSTTLISLLEKLISHLVKSPLDKDALFQRCCTILRSHLFNGVLMEEMQTRDSIVKYLSHGGKVPSNEAIYFESYYTSFINSKFLINKAGILQLLFKLAGSQNMAASYVKPAQVPSAFIIKPVTTPGSIPLHSASINDNLSSSKSGLQTSDSIRFSSSIPQKVSSVISQIVSHDKGGKENLVAEISEARLVRDVLFTFQGIDGVYIKYSEPNHAFLVTAEAGVTSSNRELCRRICELGWLYRRISAFLGKDVCKSGLIKQSFCSAIQGELTEYYRLISTLESQVLSALGKENEISFSSIQPGAPVQQSLTLKRLFIWAQIPMQRLKLMAMICDSVENVRGGALISVVETFLHHGNSLIRTFVLSLLQTICAPMYHMMQKWISLGQLDDPFSDFFVSMNVDVAPHRFWQDKYFLQKEMIPSFIGEELAKKILIIGKSINFLLTCCNDSTWLPGFLAPISNFEYGNISTLQANIDEAASTINARLIHVLMVRYKLMEHCSALKRYLLLGAGDFIVHLMDLMQTELSRPAEKVFAHHLMGFVHQAIQASTSQYDEEEITNRLTVHLLKKEKLNTGWNIFSLAYSVEPPISILFHSNCMTNGYYRIFHFLWRLKRVEFLLGRIWKQHLSDEMHVIQNWSKYKDICSLSYRSRIEMTHFVQNLLNYLMSEVLESSWDELQAAFKSADGLDDLIEAHDKYLRIILEKSLISGKDNEQRTYELLSELFELIVLFSSHQDRIHQTALEDVSNVRKLNVIYERKEGNRNSSRTSESCVDDPLWTASEYKSVENILIRFRKLFKELLIALQKYQLSSSYDVGFLMSQLLGSN